jgi:alkaline phosphatase D
MHYPRRAFLAHAARLSALGLLASRSPALAAGQVRPNWYPFRLGVASGSPLPDAVVLWTRILAEPGNAEGPAPGPIAVRWEVAEDQAFRRIAASGTASALPELAHSVHVDVGGLKPERWYWYRFMLGDAVSPVARTRTAPAPDAMPSSLRLAYASCQHWEFGEYAAHRHIAAAAPDLVAFLGDYIYEWGPYETAHPATPRRVSESFTLQDYRARYAQYKSDPQLQAAHHAAPWIVTWDDHEVVNDYADDRDYRLDPSFMARRAAAYQAFYEHMPVRPPAVLQDFARLRMFQRYDWGRLARFHVLDDRQYRSWQACPKPGHGGSNSVGASCAERMDARRTMLGPAQEAWLEQGMASSRARWNILAQQTLMAQCSQTSLHQPGDGHFWTDGWDGYPAARARLLDGLRRHRAANPLVISGDVHTFYASDIRPDFQRPASVANPVIATEFCGTSVTSNSRPQARTEQYLADNPHIRYGRSDRRGFVMMEIRADGASVLFQGIDALHSADSGMTTLARFTVEDGRPGVQAGA